MTANKATGSAEHEIAPAEAAGLLGGLIEIVSRAAVVIMAKPYAEVARRAKADRSPVTDADVAAEAVILEGLARLLPGVSIVAEESVAHAPARLTTSFVLVDPLDGTKEFLAGRDEFTVNLAIVTRGVPVAGIIAAPARGELWHGTIGGGAERFKLRWGDGPANAERTEIRTRSAPQRLIVTTSRSHLDEKTERFLARLPIARHDRCGSSIKFCRLAQGDADVYPRFSPTSEWDIAAGCAIVAAAGGAVTNPEGGALAFGRAEHAFVVPDFVAWGDPAKAGPR